MIREMYIVKTEKQLSKHGEIVEPVQITEGSLSVGKQLQ